MTKDITHHVDPHIGVFKGLFYAQFVIACQFDVAVLLNQFDDLARVYRCIFFEADIDHGWRSIDFDDAIRCAQHAQTVHVDQRNGLRWQLTKAIRNFLHESVSLRCTSPQ